MITKADNTVHRHTSLIVGLGQTGLSCARYLDALGDRVIVTDSRERPPAMSELRRVLPHIETHLGGFDEGLLNEADRLVASPGVSLRDPFILAAIRRNVTVIGDIELFAQAVEKPVAGVTGSNGKSTVTSLLGAMVRKAGRKVAVGGNIGVPALDLLSQPLPDIYVLELSSFQLERTQSLTCAVATVLNLSADHLDHHGDMAAYTKAKASIFDRCDIGVINRDDRLVCAMTRGKACPTISFGLGVPAAGQYGVVRHHGADWLARGARRLAPVSTLLISGAFNVANVLAALAMGEALGLNPDATLAAAQAFRGLAHRGQWVSDARGLIWVNDSKGTNVGATVAAIDAASTRVVLIAGGDGKGADFGPLADAMRAKGRGVVLLGKDAMRLKKQLSTVCETRLVADMIEAVAAALDIAQSGDTVLLSPACSSLDMYSGYEARGNAFVDAIQRCAA